MDEAPALQSLTPFLEFDEIMTVQAIPKKGHGVITTSSLHVDDAIELPACIWCISNEQTREATQNPMFYRLNAAHFFNDFPETRNDVGMSSVFRRVLAMLSPEAFEQGASDVSLEDMYRLMFKRNRWGYSLDQEQEYQSGSAIHVHQGSMFNHSCDPELKLLMNYHEECVQNYPITTIQLIVKKHVQKSVEANVTYLCAEELAMDVHVRRSMLLDTWDFLCTCGKCLQDLQKDKLQRTCKMCSPSKTTWVDDAKRENLLGLPIFKETNTTQTQGNGIYGKGVVAGFDTRNPVKRQYYILYDNEDSCGNDSEEMGLDDVTTLIENARRLASKCCYPCKNYKYSCAHVHTSHWDNIKGKLDYEETLLARMRDDAKKLFNLGNYAHPGANGSMSCVLTCAPCQCHTFKHIVPKPHSLRVQLLHKYACLRRPPTVPAAAFPDPDLVENWDSFLEDEPEDANIINAEFGARNAAAQREDEEMHSTQDFMEEEQLESPKHDGEMLPNEGHSAMFFRDLEWTDTERMTSTLVQPQFQRKMPLSLSNPRKHHDLHDRQDTESDMEDDS